MKICQLKNCGVVSISGIDRLSFLQGLITNDIEKLSITSPLYACLLTPQGKFLHDFIMTTDGEIVFLECERDRADELVRTLKIYALRSGVEIENSSGLYNVFVAWGDDESLAEGFYQDPRMPELGYRSIRKTNKAIESIEANAEFIEYDRHRISLAVPDGSRDMKVKLSNLLENNIDQLHGISWDKGCYTGQELTARMRYRGLLKKRIVTVTGDELPEPNSEITDADGHVVGEMRSSCGNIGLAVIKIIEIESNAELFTEDKKKLTAL